MAANQTSPNVTVDGVPIKLIKAPDLDDYTAAKDGELESLGKFVNEDSPLFFRNIREGGGVWRPFGGGPFAIDDQLGIRKQFQPVWIKGRGHASRMGKAQAALVPEGALDRRLMRRGLGTNLYRLGVPEKAIQAILRHANASTTNTYYIKSAADDTRAAMAKLEKFVIGNAEATNFQSLQ